MLVRSIQVPKARGAATLGSRSRLAVCLGSLFFALVSASSALAFVSDDFNSACQVPASAWTFTDPLGDGGAVSVGAGTADARLALTVGAGSHNPWTSGNFTPRLTQPFQDQDFDLEVKFDSIPHPGTGSYAGQGVLVEESADRYLRFDYFRSRSGAFFSFVALLDNGNSTVHHIQSIPVPTASEIYMRVARVGDQWTLYRSVDGATWEQEVSFAQPLTVATAGVFGQNYAAPSHTVLVDYFIDRNNPLTGEDGSISGSGGSKVVNVSSVGSGSVVRTPDQSTYDCGSVVTVSAIPDPGSVFDGWSGDVTGVSPALDIAVNDDRNLTATFVTSGPSLPTISSVGVSTTQTGATVAWLTDQPADSTVEFGPTAAYENGSQGDPTLTTNHSVDLTGLLPGALYHYRVTSGNGAGSASTPDATFTTALPAPPVISNVQVELGSDAAIVTWQTDVSSDSSVTFGPTTAYEGGTVASSALVTSHSIALSGLGSATLYHFQVASTDITSQTTAAPDDTFTTLPVQAPVLSNVSVSSDDTTATISWTTDQLSDSFVDYGSGQVFDPTSTTAHSMLLTGLSPGSQYTAALRSTNATGQQGTANIGFQTTGASPTLASDDFTNSCAAPSAAWSFVDPRGDSGFAYVENGGDYTLEISVPAGSDHNAWTAGNDTARMMQPADDADFVIEAKFDSSPSQLYQGHGFLVEQTPTHYLRFDVYSSGSTTKLFAAAIVDGSASIKLNSTVPAAAAAYLKVHRTGDSFLFQYSLDGGQSWLTAVSFDHALTVGSVGVFALNNGSPPSSSPAYTAVVDYFFDSSNPILPEDGPVGGPGPHVLTANAIGDGTIQVSPNQPDYACGAQVTLTGQPGPSAAFLGFSGDLSTTGNPITVTMNGPRSIVGTFQGDVVPPTISNVSAQVAADVTVTWNTDEPATSRVEYGLTTGYEVGFVDSAAPVTAHSLVVSGLSQGSTYHYRVLSVDAAGNGAASPDATFDVPISGDPGIASDDFNRNNLDLAVWRFDNSVGDASVRVTGVGSSNAQLQIELPAGVEHQVSAAQLTAPRIMQAVNDGDLQVELKLESVPAAEGHAQGLLFYQDASHYLIVGFEQAAAGLRTVARSFASGSTTAQFDVPAPVGAALYLRVDRTSAEWTVETSGDGTNWSTVGGFTHAAALSELGVFAANGGTAAADTAVVDYLFETAEPISPEDGAVAPDTAAPLLQGIAAAVSGDTATITWRTDEPADSEIDYGTTAALGLGPVVNPQSGYTHSIQIAGLQAGTTYFYRVRSSDALLQQSQSGVLLFAISGPPGQGPTVDVWYGPGQSFGGLGLPQPWVNILGNVSDVDGVAELKYTLNAGADIDLNIGPDERRLADPGDFNIDLDVDDLLAGVNTIAITAIDGLGNATVQPVTVNFDGTQIWPLPYSVDWSTTAEIHDVAQPIDGLWEIQGDTVRSLQMDYDRILGVGDVLWTDYEVTVPITINAFDPSVFDPNPSGPAAGVGMILRWPGHTPNGSQPNWGFFPLGAIGWYQIYPTLDQLQLFGNNGDGPTPKQRRTLTFGVEYMFKMRVETIAGVGGLYSFKVWEAGTAEPPSWDLQRQEALQDPQAGSVGLLSHHIDASFGPVTIDPLP